MAEIRLGGPTWCIDTPDAANSAWLQVEFGNNVTLLDIRISGLDQLFSTDYYVTRFQVFLGNNSNDVQPLLQQNSSEPLVGAATA